MVDQAGLAHVGAPDDRHRDAVVLVLVFIIKVQMFAHSIQQIAGAVTVNAGNRDQLAQTQRVEIVQLHGRFADLVALVDRQHHGLAAAHQHTGNVLILRGDAVGQLGDHNDAVRRVDGDLRLLAHMRQQTVVNARLDTAGIHQQKFMPAPFAIAENAVAGDTGGVLHNGKALTGQLVEDGGLAHVGASHNGYDRFCHISFPPLSVFVSVVCGGAYPALPCSSLRRPWGW